MSKVRAHHPVMLGEVLAAIVPQDGDTIVDGTFGAGGYATAFLEAARCTVYGIDRDEAALEHAKALGGRYSGRLKVLRGKFADMVRLLDAEGVSAANGVALDLGVSSMQLDDPARGFSFRNDGPLDMRMGGARDPDTQSAASVVASIDEVGLADLIWRYGEERKSRKIAKAIVEARREVPITRTRQLADIVARAIKRKGRDKIHPATRTFQALRIYVNDELGQLEQGLQAAERLLAPQGRLAVVSFHSLEDRIVKSFLRQRSGSVPRVSRYLPSPPNSRTATFSLQFRGAQKPGDDEIAQNARARSARLRAATRTAAPAWPTPDTGLAA